MLVTKLLTQPYGVMVSTEVSKTFSLGSNPSRATNQNISIMKKCAIILNGSDVVKINNLKRKYNKLINNPEIKILEECDEHQLEEKYLYWCQTIKPMLGEESADKPLKYHWRNRKTGYTLHSIYPTLKNIDDIDDWQPYEE